MNLTIKIDPATEATVREAVEKLFNAAETASVNVKIDETISINPENDQPVKNTVLEISIQKGGTI